MFDKKQWYLANRTEQRSKNNERCQLKRLEILKLLGDKCSKCGFTDKRALQVDHVNGDGFRERRFRSISSWKLLVKVKDDIKKGGLKYQLLCANCNTIKVSENNERPFVHSCDG